MYTAGSSNASIFQPSYTLWSWFPLHLDIACAFKRHFRILAPKLKEIQPIWKWSTLFLIFKHCGVISCKTYRKKVWIWSEAPTEYARYILIGRETSKTGKTSSVLFIPYFIRWHHYLDIGSPFHILYCSFKVWQLELSADCVFAYTCEFLLSMFALHDL